MKRFFSSIFVSLVCLIQTVIAQEQCSCPFELCQAEVYEPQYRCANLSLFADFLYWKADVSNLPYALFAESQTNLITYANNESPKEISFSSDPGFRIGLGYQFDQGWDLVADYTYFHTSGDTEKRATSPEIIIPLWDLALPSTIDTLSAKQSLKFDQINIDFVKHFSLGTHFSLDPFFGAKGAKIHQRLNIAAHQVFDPPSKGVVTTNVKNFFDGGGLDIGLQTNCSFLRCLSFYGKGSYSLLYGKFKLSVDSQDNIDLPPPSTILHEQNKHEFSLVNAFDLSAGIKTTWSFSCYDITAHLDYEFVYWPGQVRVPRIRSDISTKTPTTLLNDAHGDVSLHGLTTGLIISF